MAVIEEEYCVFSSPPAPITCHAWSGDGSQVALCPGNHQIVVLSRDSQTHSFPHDLTMVTSATHRPMVELPKSGQPMENAMKVLGDHEGLVTCIDWAPETKRIVSCAQDRNAYVWTPSVDSYKPTLVILRFNRAATCIKWSPRENKFAVGSNSRMMAIAYFEQDNDWWVCKHIKKPIRSTVLSLDWHPNNSIIACGAADYRVRVFSAYIKNLDTDDVFSGWGPVGSFGDMLAEFSCEGQGWIHGVAFSPSGDYLAWASKERCSGTFVFSRREARLVGSVGREIGSYVS
jgi:actin related protein 2/3 complex subunit 1A/1B